MTLLTIIAAIGLLLGLVLARIAAHGRRIRLTEELRRAETEANALAEIEAVLFSYPFGEGIEQVRRARENTQTMRKNARSRVRACQTILAGSGKVRP